MPSGYHDAAAATSSEVESCPVGTERGTGWFAARALTAVRDFFAICDRTLEANAASARELERVAGPTDGRSIEQQVEGARERMRRAAAGDWEPFEQHLRALGAQFAGSGLGFPAWYTISNQFYAAVVPRLTEELCSEPAHLAETLLVLGDYQERSMSIIAGEYFSTKEALRKEAEVRHAQLMEASLDPVIGMDQDGIVTEFNAAAERTFGYPHDMAIGRSLASLVIPEAQRASHDAGLQRLISTDESTMLGRRIEVTATRADGSEIPVELAIVQRRLPDGKRAFVGFLRDLTERKRTEESSALWTHALDQALFGVVITEVATTRVSWVNAAYARMLGYEPDELIGMHGRSLIAPTTNVRSLEIRERVAQEGSVTLVVELLRKDGTTVPVLISTSVVAAGPGRTVRVSTVLDNTQLAQSTSRLEILSRTAHELAAAEGDVVGLIDLVARRLAESIGDSCTVRMLTEGGEATDKRAAFFHVDPVICAAARAALDDGPHPLGAGMARQVVATGRAVMASVMDPAVIVAQAPAVFKPMLDLLAPHSVLAIPLNARGRTLGVASLLRGSGAPPYTADDKRFAQDLADRAGLAIDNAVLLATLEEKVAERTRALEASNRELESFSYSVSHDLRAPLRAIDSFSALLLEDNASQLDADGQHLLERVRTNAQRMASLIEGLLALSGVTRATMIRARVDLSALATEILGELARIEPERHVVTHVTPGIHVHADIRLVRILLENLLGNAWKFTAKRETPEIRIGGDATTFFVRDNGAGFDLRFVDDLFVPFRRLHHADEFAGTGVGLATVHRIVRHHGGKIRVEAAPDQGAAFFVTLAPSE